MPPRGMELQLAAQLVTCYLLCGRLLLLQPCHSAIGNH